MSTTEYTHEELVTAYRIWASAKREDREREWALYLDIRDGVPPGTNEARMNKRFQRNGNPYRENKLDAQVWK